MFNLFSKKPAGTTVVLKLTGLHCTSCALMIDSVLEDLPGVIKSDTNYAKSESLVHFDSQKINPEKLIAEIEVAGYQAEVK